MKGLFYKDFVTLLDAYKKNLVFVLVIYTAMTVALDMPFLLYAMIFLLGMYALSSLSFDELCRWDAYARTLPVSPWRLVACKYLTGLACMGIGMVLALALLLGSDLVRGLGLAGGATYLLGCVSALVVVLVYYAVAFPLSYKMGANKARSGVMMVMALLFFGCFMLFRLLPDELSALEDTLNAVSDRSFLLFIALMFAAGLAAYLVSWGISTAIYCKKEF